MLVSSLEDCCEDLIMMYSHKVKYKHKVEKLQIDQSGFYLLVHGLFADRYSS